MKHSPLARNTTLASLDNGLVGLRLQLRADHVSQTIIESGQVEVDGVGGGTVPRRGQGQGSQQGNESDRELHLCRGDFGFGF